MDNQSVKQVGRNATNLVRTITLIGLGSGLFMLGILYWTISQIHADRENLDKFQAALTRMVTSLDTYLEEGRNDIDRLLNRNKPSDDGDDGAWVQRLIQLSSDDELSVATANADIREPLQVVGARVLELKKLRSDCVSWNRQAEQLNVVFPAARKRVEASLGRLESAIIGIEGRQRLQRAIQIRDYRRSSGPEAIRLGHQIISGMGRGSQIVTIKTELADLSLLYERLLSEDQVDNLADLKDNKFKATLDRLRRGISLLGNPEVQEKDAPMLLLDRLGSNLFGSGFRRDDIHQTIIPGTDGLYLLIRDKLLLATRRDELRQRKDRLLNDTRSARRHLVATAEDIAQSTAQGTEAALSKTWNTMLTVWLVFFSAFLVLSVKITQAVRRQIRAIETTNENLTAEILERQKVEAALRQSEEALRKAKDELEMRVEERTRELKDANQQLGKEIAERKSVEAELRRRSKDLANALKTTRKARQIAEAERDRSGKMLAEVTESKRRLEILISDATEREKRMVDLKREINTLLSRLGRDAKYEAPQKVAAFLAR